MVANHGWKRARRPTWNETAVRRVSGSKRGRLMPAVVRRKAKVVAGI